ncbi:HD domain-containing protein [Candidatus Woesearchaeota archaeon]|jgi:HD superfamily phosphodiesterase|nr:HD domain-containing protein [Candidatus Woesearchaeota archaeon]
MHIIEQIEIIAKQEYEKHDSNHQWNHVTEVMNTGLTLAKYYPKTDLEILKISIMLHDVIYTKYKTHVDNSADFAKKLLKKLKYPDNKIDKVIKTIFSHSGPHRRKFGDADFIEGKIIYDSDKFRCALSKEGFEKYKLRFYLPETLILIKQVK